MENKTFISQKFHDQDQNILLKYPVRYLDHLASGKGTIVPAIVPLLHKAFFEEEERLHSHGFSGG